MYDQTDMTEAELTVVHCKPKPYDHVTKLHFESSHAIVHVLLHNTTFILTIKSSPILYIISLPGTIKHSYTVSLQKEGHSTRSKRHTSVNRLHDTKNL